MATIKLEFDTYADIIAQDVDERLILLITAQATTEPINSELESILTKLQFLKLPIPFIMLVDLKKIRIYKCTDTNPSLEPVKSFSTTKVLQYYEPDFENKKIFKRYLISLVEAWLRDVAYQWKSDTPPEFQQLSEIGLSQQLQGGTTQSNVNLNLMISPISDKVDVISSNV